MAARLSPPGDAAITASSRPAASLERAICDEKIPAPSGRPERFGAVQCPVRRIYHAYDHVPIWLGVLQPSGWGMVVYAQNFSVWMILVLEYGFGFSATREIARHRDDPERHADIARGVVGANVILLLPSMP